MRGKALDAMEGQRYNRAERREAAMTAERAYEELVKSLAPAERLRLVEKIVHGLSVEAPEGEAGERYDWMAMEGVAPNLLAGEDAQEWVTRTRQESDEHREEQWKGKP